ncbi:DUF6233 domain-containing protein [Streptomyces galilaeus]
MWLERIDRKAAALRQRQAEEERSRARRPPVPDWFLELNRATGHPLAVHVGDCGMTGRRTDRSTRMEPAVSLSGSCGTSATAPASVAACAPVAASSSISSSRPIRANSHR